MAHEYSNDHRAVHVQALLGLLLTAAASLAFAARPVRVYEVNVHGAAAGAAQEAMRQVLVRATGRRDAASNPAFADLIGHASQYVRSSRSLGNDVSRITFDEAAVEKQIVAAGGSVWDQQRPFTIVVLSPPPTGSAADEARQNLEQIAEGRGLPVTLAPMDVTDSSGNPLASDALLAGAQRLGGDAILLGRGDPATAAWQWTLLTGFSTASWNGTLADGINGAADALSQVQGNALPLADQDAIVEVSGVMTLSDYASVERTLDELPGVRSSGLEETDGTSARFHVLIRGGAQEVERALVNAPHLERTGTAGGMPLTYLFRP